MIDLGGNMDIDVIEKAVKIVSKTGYTEGNMEKIKRYLATKKKEQESSLSFSDLMEEPFSDKSRLPEMALESLEKYVFYKDDIYIYYAILNLTEMLIPEKRRRYENLVSEKEDRLDAERAFVSCVLHDEGILERCELWRDHRFMDETNFFIFEAARSLNRRGKRVCAKSVKEYLRGYRSQFVDVIFNIVPSSANADYYANVMTGKE
jgi:hypothetical protein